MIAEITLIVTIYILLKVFKDLITHHDMFKYYKFSKFFWRETVYAVKKSLFHKYFPMFYDMWHLAEAFQILLLCIVSVVMAVPTATIWFVLLCALIAYIVASLMFNFFYEALGNGH